MVIKHVLLKFEHLIFLTQSLQASVRARLRLAACMQGRIVIVACCSFVFIYTYECVFINYLCIISLYIVKRVSQFKHTNQTCAAQKDAQHFYCLLYQVSESGPRNL